MSRRDRDLAPALRHLWVPEHSPDFATRLRRGLDARDTENLGDRAMPSPPAVKQPAVVEPAAVAAEEGSLDAAAAAAAAEAAAIAGPVSETPEATLPRHPPSESAARAVHTEPAHNQPVRAEPVRAEPVHTEPVRPEPASEPAPEEEADALAPLRPVVPAEPTASAPQRPVVPAEPTVEVKHTGRRLRRHPAVWLVAAIALVALLVAAIMTIPGTEDPDRAADTTNPGTPETAVTDVKGRVTQALGAVTSLRGVLVMSGEGDPEAPKEMRWNIASTVSGDFRMIGNNPAADGSVRTEAIAHDAQKGVERVFLREGGGEPVAEERTGLSAGPPDPGPSTLILQRGLGSLVRALLAADDPSVSDATYEGRPAWALSADVEPNRIADVEGDRLEVTVDQATGFPVGVRLSLDDQLVREYRLEKLEINPRLTSGQFNMTFPEGVEVVTTDHGFRRVPDPAATVGYAPLEPAWLPEGFTLALITVAEEAQPTGKEATNPASRSVVSAAYRRGFDEIVISTRLLGDDPSLWSDPLASGEGFIDDPETVELGAGALEGREAEIVIGPRSIPHLWAMSDSLVVTVAGDLTRSELIKVTESLGAGGE